MKEQSDKNKKKKEQVTVRSSAAEYLNYVACVGNDEQQIEIRYEDENIWLTQKLMAALYGVEVHTINYHIKKIFADSELQADSVIRKFRITAPDGKQYNTNHYSLEMIIAVGFKVNSEKAVQFRKWVNGKALMELLKQPLCNPLSMAEEVIILVAATNKVFLPVEVSEVKKKKLEMLEYFHSAHKDIVDEIEEKQVLTDELKDKIVAAAKEFIER